MAEDIKSLTKKVADLEKRLKFNETKIKALADNMTDSKGIEKYLEVLNKKIGKDLEKGLKISDKALNREMEIANRAREARDKDWDKESEKINKENDKMRKQFEKLNKESARQAEMNLINVRLATVEALVKSALAR